MSRYKAVLDVKEAISDLPVVATFWKHLCALMLLGALVAGPACGEPVPPDVLRAAAAATQRLGDEVVKGNFSYTIQKMHPRWKKRAAMRSGGMENLVEKLAQLPREMAKHGISMMSFKADPPKSAFEVDAFGEWVVFVPTRSVLRVIDTESATVRRLEKSGFQVAVLKKGEGDWFFIDGTALTIADLRSLFPNLPADRGRLGLPPVGTRELKG